MELLTAIESEVKNGQVSEYSEVTAKLAELKDMYGHEVPDASSKEGYDRAKEISKVCTSIRTATEVKRKAFKAPVLAFGKMIDSEAKRIVEEVLEIETPHKSAYQEVDQIKKQRKLDIENRIIEIKEMPSKAMVECLDSNQVNGMIENLSEIDVSTETFGRRVDEASALVASTLEKLSEMCAQKIEQEQEQLRIEAERSELEKLRREAEEREAAQREAGEQEIREAEQARIAEEAAQRAIEEERARQKAETERLEREHQKAIEREEQLKREAELAEQRRIELEKQAELDRVAAEKQAKIDAEAAAERARQAEIQRQKKEEAERIAEQQRLEENKRHAAKIHNAMVQAIASECGIDEETARNVVRAIAGKKVPHVVVNY